MKLTLLSQQELRTMILPEKCAGSYWIKGRDDTGKVTDIVTAEAVRDFEANGEPEWLLRSNRRFQIYGRDNQVLQSVSIRPMELYRIESAGHRLKFVLYTEPLSEDRKTYRAYEIIHGEAKITVGRNTDNTIIFDNGFVSRHHSEIVITRESMTVRDLDSSNHTYVNGRAVRYAALKNGDVVYVMGLQIIVTHGFISLNQPDGAVVIQDPNLREYHTPGVPGETGAEYEEDDIGAAEEYYYRPPRFKQDVETLELNLNAPPANQNKDEMPMIMLIGPSMTMGMASVATGVYAVANAVSRGDITSAIPSIVMSISMLLGTLMWPLVTRTYQRKQKQKREEQRQEGYRAYLAQMDRLLAQETGRQERILRENELPPGPCFSEIFSSKGKLWEKTHKHTDFLNLRLGEGNLPLDANIRLPERRFSIDEDNLTEELYQFGEKKRWLTDVPVCLPLQERFISGICGDRELLFEYARNLILRIAVQHGYDEVKLAVIYDENDADIFSFTHWLPHTVNHERTVRYLAANTEETKLLSSALDPVMEYRKSLNDGALEDEMPYYVIICLDKKLASKTECVRRLLEYKKNLKFSVLCLYEKLEELPKECSAVVKILKDGSGSLTLIHDVSDPPVPFRPDLHQQIDVDGVTKLLANTEIDESGSNYTLPAKYTFFEMLEIGMIEHVNILDQWASNDPTKSLAAAIGVDRYGEVLKLDLHERAHGPHGLIAGMTGSGKSEFIISFILSMAMNYHPYEAAFILIDYKGGGMAKSFEHLPHTAGVITNLDGHGINRSLVSMRSELHRRERIFRDTTLKYNVSNIDIYKYQKLYREGKVAAPLPHLFIISDEFAELKKEQPDFMSELTSTARVGRSLGVHLILATQKPGGVVDDQIRSNSRFRVCLKVQDNADSMEMLGRPEAAALMNTGRFYLQVGNNELFEIGQSAWAGAPYYPSPRVVKERDDAVLVVNTSGRTISEANIERFAGFKDPPKQLDVAVEYIRKVSEEEGIAHWKMWLDPIPGQIYVDRLEEKYPQPLRPENRFVLEPIAGEYDDPAHQAQRLMKIPITSDGNLIVYGSAGSGKEMFLEAICYSLIKSHSPQEVNLYLLDFGSEMLTSFAAAPHVGDVILSCETEKVENLFKLLIGKLGARKKKLSEFGGSFMQYNIQAREPEPGIVVIINNFAAFNEIFEDKAAEINYLTREGTKYGVYFVLACTGVNHVRFSLRQNFGSLFCLQLNNADDYSAVVGKTDGLLPEKIRGRGLFRPAGGDLYEFQTASITPDDPPYPYIRAFAQEQAERYTAKYAARVPVLPEKVDEAFLAPHVKKCDLSCVPVGVEKETLDISYYNFAESPVNLVLSANQEWRGFTDALCTMTANRCQIQTMLLVPAGRPEVKQTEKLRVFSDESGCVQAVREIYRLVRTRNNDFKTALEEKKPAPDFEPVFVLIQSISLLKTLLDRYKPEDGVKKEADDDTPLNRLQLAMEKCEKEYRVCFVAAENAKSLRPFTVENWYKAHVNGSHGIWVGSGVDSQFWINFDRRSRGAAKDPGPGFGFVIRNASASLVKLLQG